MSQLKCVSGLRFLTRVTLLAGAVFLLSAVAFAQGKPEKLECESLVTPLGVDTKQPVLSWQLRDVRFGAKQTAYQIQVALSVVAVTDGKADVWDSGKVESDHSIGIAYAGKELKPSTRYFWRVKVWDKDGKAYPPSEVSWWETGLMDQSAWKANWIGYETPEMQAVRGANAEWITNGEKSSEKIEGDSHHQFRFAFALGKAVRRATLYATVRDTAAAWVNCKQVLE